MTNKPVYDEYDKSAKYFHLSDCECVSIYCGHQRQIADAFRAIAARERAACYEIAEGEFESAGPSDIAGMKVAADIMEQIKARPGLEGWETKRQKARADLEQNRATKYYNESVYATAQLQKVQNALIELATQLTDEPYLVSKLLEIHKLTLIK